MHLVLLILLFSVFAQSGETEIKLPVVNFETIRSRKTRTYLIRIDQDDALLKSQPFVKLSNDEWIPVYRHKKPEVPPEEHHDENHIAELHSEHTTPEKAYKIWWWTLVLNGSLLVLIVLVCALKRMVRSSFMWLTAH